MSRAVRVLAALIVVAMLLVPTAAWAQDRVGCVETGTAAPGEVTTETDPVSVCRGPAIPGTGGGVGAAGGAGGGPTRIDAGAGGMATASSGGLVWLSLGTVAAVGLLRRRRS